eukprot:NODE_10940_length_1319_cov_7.472315.p1 GENE.NODE_10940_length_1319_cov_7.472315~~NODE_10940_length_1319_cov_7.472315.p1  ORF type:complete len:196 (+),score=45.93 NODE_10940_length_1319_cov_7.472315:223-810(+)
MLWCCCVDGGPQQDFNDSNGAGSGNATGLPHPLSTLSTRLEGWHPEAFDADVGADGSPRDPEAVARYEETSMPQASSESTVTFTVELRRHSVHHSLGTSASRCERRALRVRSVAHDGVLAEWNMLNPLQSVLVDDLIIEVNGITPDHGGLGYMLEELRTATSISAIVMREAPLCDDDTEVEIVPLAGAAVCLPSS